MSPLIPALSSLLGIQYPPDCPLGKYGLIVATAMAALTTLLVYEILTFRDATKASLSRTLVGVFAILYVGLPMALMVIIRQQAAGSADQTTGSNIVSGVESQWGFAALVTFIAVTNPATQVLTFAASSWDAESSFRTSAPEKPGKDLWAES